MTNTENTAQAAPVVAASELTDEQIARLYRESFNSMGGRLREASKHVPDTVLEFARNIERTIRAAAPAASVAVPAGYALVPQVPTMEMARPAVKHIENMCQQDDDEPASFHKMLGFVVMVFAEMVAAAPATPAAQAQQPAGDGWKPMATAPKDGTEVMLWLGAPYNEIAKAWWFKPWENWQKGELPNALDDEYYGIGSEVPTHWMPLPSVPWQTK